MLGERSPLTLLGYNANQWRIQLCMADRAAATHRPKFRAVVVAARSSLPQTRGKFSFKALNFCHFLYENKMDKKLSALPPPGALRLPLPWTPLDPWRARHGPPGKSWIRH